MSLCDQKEAERRREARVVRWRRQIAKERGWRHADLQQLRAEALSRMAVEDRHTAEAKP